MCRENRQGRLGRWPAWTSRARRHAVRWPGYYG